MDKILFPDESSTPPADPAPREAAPQTNPLTLTDDEVRFFSSEQELKDIAAGVALKGVPADEALKVVTGGYESRLTALRLKYDVAVAELDEAIAEAKRRIDADEDRAAALRQRIENRRREREQVAAKIERLEYVITAGLNEVRKKRFERGKEFFDNQGKFLEEGARKTHDELLEELKVQRALGEEIYKTQKEYWENDQKEFERRAGLAEKELAAIETQLGKARDRVTRLSDLGISRTTANFLIWVGYISMAGVGGVIGGFIQRRQNADSDFLSIIFRGFFNLVQLAQPPQPNAGPLSFITAPLPFVLMVVVYMVMLVAIIWGTDWLLKKFDPTWTGGAGKGKEKGRQQRERTGLLDRFSSYIPTPEVDRKSYRQLLAYFPYIILASLVIWGLSAGISPSKSGGAQTLPVDPTHGLAATYLGVIFSLLSTSAAMLYATKVIEHRSRRLEADGGGTFGKYLRMNWEFALLIVLMVAALVLAAVLPLTPPAASGAAPAAYDYNIISLGATAIFMCLCSMGLAYGLIQRGLFREVDYLERWRLFHRKQIEKNRMGPTFHEVLEEYGTNDEVRNLLTGYRQARHILDEARVLYELREVFDADFDDDGALRKYLRRLWPSSDLRLLGRRLKAAPPGEPRPIDYVAAPEATARVLVNRVEKRSSQERVEAIDAELARLAQESTDLKNRLERLAQAQTVRRRQKVSLAQEYERLRAALAVGRDKDVLKFQAAYAVGQLAHGVLKDDLVPPPAPPPLQPPLTPTQVM